MSIIRITVLAAAAALMLTTTAHAQTTSMPEGGAFVFPGTTAFGVRPEPQVTVSPHVEQPFVTRYGVRPVIHHTPQPLVEHGRLGRITVTTLFDSGRSDLRPLGTQVLDDMLDRVADFQPHYGMGHNGRVLGGRIVGHTDSVGSEASNQRLSERRAAAIARYLDSQGANTRRLNTSGMGENLPVASNANAMGRAQNRRSELTLDVLTLPGY